ncbi:hypothetical protein [Longirhabdus pacifica]|uniref:hypothetical protein n=1 Tax=Longirhabdus pacifica TaxID=2305227 RepID=UPI0013E8DFCB|nr:hypothetical protein [Longirhabdus pacifica]
MNNGVLIYVLISFVLGALVIYRREELPEKYKRPIAILALFFVVSGFVFLLASFFTAS